MNLYMKKLFVLLPLTALFLFTKCETKKQNNSVKLTLKNLDSLIKIYPDSVPLLVSRGNKLFDKYDFYGALADGAKAFHLDSSNWEARFLYANALNNKADRGVSDVDQAQKHFLYLIKSHPGNKRMYIALASTYTFNKDYEKSFQYINTALRIDTRYRDAYVLKGTNYLALGNRKLAKSSYETAVQQDPKFYEGYLALGYLYSEDNDPIAVEYFRTASDLKPTSIDALYGVAYSLQQQRKFEESLAEYRHLLEVDPKFYLALFNQGYIKQFEQNQIDSAVHYYDLAIQLQPKFVKGWHNLGLCYAAQNRKADAMRAFSTALRYNPNFEISRIEANRLR
jgi:tetratricopeptide (TPR) repeat protein